MKEVQNKDFSEVTPQIEQLAGLSKRNGNINPELYSKYEVKRGLRDISGQGVLAGLTEISQIQSYIVEDHEMVPCQGRLYYRGINIREIVGGFLKEKRFGFEETIYLLLFGELPNKKELQDFQELLEEYRSLPTGFVRDIIMKAPSKDMMNTLARSVLTMYSYDNRADDTSLPNVLRQC
ncbi:MAG TPA: citrate synthase, partial [Lachnospiraceae bacterium]|nr:citrate synthase [Lachnospiraceae bacterium]